MTEGEMTVDVQEKHSPEVMRAAEVVDAYRKVDWKAVERGEGEAITAYFDACERDEQTRSFLEASEEPSASKILAGLGKVFLSEVAQHLRNPNVVKHLGQVSEAGGVETEAVVGQDGLNPRPRPNTTIGDTRRMTTGCGSLYVTINENAKGEPFELFNHMGKAGGCAASQNEAIGRLISYALRCGASIEPLIKQLKGISCHRPAWGDKGKISSCADAIGKALEEYHLGRVGSAGIETPGDDVPPTARSDGIDLVPDELDPTSGPTSSREGNRLPSGSYGDHSNRVAVVEETKVQGACRDCGGQLAYEEGCVKCYGCGFTECG